jgi:hypothetical protein
MPPPEKGQVPLLIAPERRFRSGHCSTYSHLETVKMRSLTLTGVTLLVAPLLTGCGAAAGPTGENTPTVSADAMTVNHSSSVTPLDYIFVSPCNGEDIHVTGTLSAKETFLGTGDGVHRELQVVTFETGLGLTTGATYRSHDVNHETFSAPTPESRFRTYTFHETYYFITQTPGLSFRGQFFTHFVETPNGDGKFTRDVGSLECRA